MTSPELEAREEQFASLVAACDEALEAGLAPPMLSTADAPPGLPDRLERGIVCLRLLRRCLARPATPPPSGATDPPRGLGRFEVRRELGRGAFGVVFLAFDPLLRREVALKVPRADALVSRELRERFLTEARAAAALDHPNLVPVYEAGEVGPLCYLTSAYVAGPTLDRWLKDQADPLPSRATAALLTCLADALQYAHSRGVVHRDLKPSNVLLEAPGEGGDLVPRVTDFGLAKLVGAEGPAQTHSGQILGTPAYMAPEQAAGQAHVAGPAADVYALGAILYDCLTGRPPFQGDTVLDVLVQVRTSEPVAPRALRPGVPRDLETICLKCLHKEAHRRYASAGELAEDLRSFLAGRPIRARRAGAAERAWRWCRRNPVVAALAGSLAALLLLATAGASLAALQLKEGRDDARNSLTRAREAEIEAREAEGRATANLRSSYLQQARALRQSGRDGQRFLALAALAEAARVRPGADLTDEALACLALPDLGNARRVGGTLPAECGACFDPAMAHYARSDGRGELSVRAVADDRELARLPGAGAPIGLLRFSPDGRLLAARGRIAPAGAAGVKVWDWRRRRVVLEQRAGMSRPYPGSPRYGLGLDFSPDGRALAVGGSWSVEGIKNVRLFDLATGAQTRAWAVPHLAVEVAFRPDGRQLAVACGEGRVEVRDAGSGEVVRALPLSNRGPLHALAWSRDGRLLAGASKFRLVHVWDLAEGGQLDLEGHVSQAIGVTFGPGRLLASHDLGGETRLWDAASGRQVLRAPGRGLSFSADGRWLPYAQGAEVGVWEVAAARECRRLYAGSGHLGLDFSPDGKLLAVSGATVSLWGARDDGSAAATVPNAPLPNPAVGLEGSAVFGKDGSLFTTGMEGLWRWPVRRGLVGPGEVTVGPREPWERRPLGQASLDWGRRRLAAVEYFAPPRGKVPRPLGIDPFFPIGALVRDLVPGAGGARHLRQQVGGLVALSPGGGWAATATPGRKGVVGVWDVAAGKLVRELPGGPARAAFSPDGRWLVVALEDEYRFYRTGSWEAAHKVQTRDMAGEAGALAFSADGLMLAVTHARDQVRLVEPVTGRHLLTLRAPDQRRISALRFSPDGSLLAVVTKGFSNRPPILVWDLGLARRALAAAGLAGELPDSPPSRSAEAAPPLRVRVLKGG